MCLATRQEPWQDGAPRNHHRRRYREAFSLPETLSTLGVGGLILAAILTFWSFSARSLASIANYIDLDQRSRHALDLLSREIRQSAGVRAVTPKLHHAVESRRYIDAHPLGSQSTGRDIRTEWPGGSVTERLRLLPVQHFAA